MRDTMQHMHIQYIFSTIKLRLGVVVHTFSLSTGKAERQVDLGAFEASLV